MVVVLIIGILVAIAIPIFNNASKQAKLNTCKANIRTINGAIAQKATTDGKALADMGSVAISDLVGDYLKSTPKCPYDIAYTVSNGTVDEAAHISTDGKSHVEPAAN